MFVVPACDPVSNRIGDCHPVFASANTDQCLIPIMRIIITGGGGFLGSQLCGKLL
ncbi:MAG: hypothetical protein ACI91J_002125, partial [Yoonia sp.]